MMQDKIIFELSSEGRSGVAYPICDVPQKKLEELLDAALLRQEELNLPQVSEFDVVRHFSLLSQKNFGVDTNFYPLGSCTMKYNPKVCEDIAAIANFKNVHPLQDVNTVAGTLQIIYETQQMLSEICGMDAFTLTPAAGAHGELLGILLIRAYHQKMGNVRTKIVLPDSAHGTNPASAQIAGYDVVTIKSNEKGEICLDALRAAMDNETAALMITNPNTLGIFESKITEIAKIVHDSGALLYCDGANLNAMLGVCRPGDLGFDVMHVNLHKTFATPHGGGGPGSGPVGVKKELIPFLPIARVVKDTNANYLFDSAYPDSIGKIKAFYGNMDVIIKAYAYLKALGKEGVLKVGLNAVLNANYLRENLKDYFSIPYGADNCKHEFVISLEKEAKEHHVHALDVAKYLLDQGIHAPTIYFPLIVPEAIMIEPTETESKETLDNFIALMRDISLKIKTCPEEIINTPKNLSFCRFDEVLAARKPDLKWVDPKAAVLVK